MAGAHRAFLSGASQHSTYESTTRSWRLRRDNILAFWVPAISVVRLRKKHCQPKGSLPWINAACIRAKTQNKTWTT